MQRGNINVRNLLVPSAMRTSAPVVLGTFQVSLKVTHWCV